MGEGGERRTGGVQGAAEHQEHTCLGVFLVFQVMEGREGNG